MTLRWILFRFTVALLASFAMAQSSAKDELPSAPSATLEQQNQAKKPPSAPPQAAPPEQRSSAEPQPSVEPPASPKQETQNQSPTESANPAPRGGTESTTQPGRTESNKHTESQNEDGDESRPIVRKRVDEVNVVFTVTDKHGRYVKDLKRDDFKVVDDNKPAEQIRSFRTETDLPLQVGLLIDASNSVRDRFKFEQESAIEFLNQTIRRKYDKAFVIGFDVTPEVTQDFTDSTDALSRGVRALRPGGGTAMFDALYFACRDKLRKAPQAGPVRRAVILLSDGDDNQSHVTREEAIEMAQRAEVIVYTISTNVSGMKKGGDKVLERIAAATGGRAFFPFQIRDVADAFAEIQDELRSQYALSYKPADFRPDGRFRTIEIMAQNHKHLHVRARRGYYAPVE